MAGGAQQFLGRQTVSLPFTDPSHCLCDAGADLQLTIATAGKAVGFDVDKVARARDPMTA